MAKIILTRNGVILQELKLIKERTTIGRRSHNDLIIDNLAVSGEHAVIITIYNDSFLEDLNSTNGTQVNGQSVTKQFLQPNDVIQIAGYKLLYVPDSDTRTADVSEKDFPEPRPDAYITVLDGPTKGRQMRLSKVLTTIGRPGLQVAIVTRRPHGYELTHVEGDTYTRLNGEPQMVGAQQLRDGDVITIGGIPMRFTWEAEQADRPL